MACARCPSRSASREPSNAPAAGVYAWPDWVGNKRRCDGCQKNASHRRCDFDPVHSVGCTWCRTRSEYMKTGHCTFNDRQMQPRPATKGEAFHQGLRHFCDVCTRDNTVCDWAKDLATQPWACSRCNGKGRVCKRDGQPVPLASGSIRASEVSHRDPSGRKHPYRRVAERCLLCRQFGTHPFCNRTATRGCNTCARFGLVCLDAKSEAILPADPDLAGTGKVSLQLLYERCRNCAANDLPCDRTDPCFQCRLLGIECGRQNKRNTINPIAGIGLELPLYSLALGFGPQGIGSSRPPNRPDVPGPPYPLHTDAIWPGSLHPRKNGAMFPRVTLLPGSRDIAPVSEAFMAPELTLREKVWFAKGVKSAQPSLGEGEYKTRGEVEADGEADASFKSISEMSAPSDADWRLDGPRAHGEPTNTDLQAEPRFDTIVSQHLNPHVGSALLDLQAKSSTHMQQGFRSHIPFGANTLANKFLNIKVGEELAPPELPSRLLESKPCPRHGNAMHLRKPPFCLHVNRPENTDSTLFQGGHKEYPEAMAMRSLPTDGKDPTYGEFCFGTCQEITETKYGMMRHDAPVYVPLEHCEDRTHASDRPFCLCQECHARNRAILNDPRNSENSALAAAQILFSRAFVCHKCLETGGVEELCRELKGRPIWGLDSSLTPRGRAAKSGSNTDAMAVLRGPLSPGWGCACWKLLNRKQCRTHRLRNVEAWLAQVTRMHAWMLAAFGERICPLCQKRTGVDAHGFHGKNGGEGLEQLVWACLNCCEFVIADRKWATQLLPGSGIGEQSASACNELTQIKS